MNGKALGSDGFLTKLKVECFVVEYGVVWIRGGLYLEG